MSGKSPTVYIIDDDESFRKSLRRLVQALEFKAVEFDSAVSFLKHEKYARPACILLDFSLPGMDGLSLQEKLAQQGLEIPIVFVTGHGSVTVSVQAMKNGALDFLQKPFSFNELSQAIANAIAVEEKMMRREKITGEIRSFFAFLTEREQEVLRWVITGKPSKQIASKLGTTEKTIRIHRSRIMKKMRVSSVAELVRSAQMIDINPPAR